MIWGTYWGWHDGHAVFGSPQHLFYFNNRSWVFFWGTTSAPLHFVTWSWYRVTFKRKIKRHKARRLRFMARLWPSITLSKSYKLYEGWFHFFFFLNKSSASMTTNSLQGYFEDYISKAWESTTAQFKIPREC